MSRRQDSASDDSSDEERDPSHAQELRENLHFIKAMEYQLKKVARGGAKVETKMKNLVSGGTINRTFDSGFKLEEADIQNVASTYLYNDGTNYMFMENESFEQHEFPGDKLGDTVDFLREDLDVFLMLWNGHPINVDLPPTITLEVTQTDPGVKGDTAAGASKPATMETGLVVQVPLFINAGDKVVVNTSTKEYKERAKS